MSEPIKTHARQLRMLLTTLMVNGYHLIDVDRVSTVCSILSVYKYDTLGGQIRYSIVLTDSITNGITTRTESIAKKKGSTVFGIGETKTDKCKWYDPDTFYDMIGGPVNHGLVLNPNLPSLMAELGLRNLPHGMEGRAEDHLELYAKECLQYLLQVPVRRYGIDRSFESLPDGVVLGKDLVMIFDAKAHSGGFSFESDDINRFEKYVNDFKNKYGHIFPQINSFIVVSGKFNDPDASIQGRSNELIARCQTPICCIMAEELGKMVQLFLDNPGYRRSIPWKRMLTNIRFRYNEVESALNTIKKDQIIS